MQCQAVAINLGSKKWTPLVLVQALIMHGLLQARCITKYVGSGIGLDGIIYNDSYSHFFSTYNINVMDFCDIYQNIYSAACLIYITGVRTRGAGGGNCPPSHKIGGAEPL